MRRESPEFKRCCFCLPLRRGLIGWGYVRLALDILGIIRDIFFAFYWCSRHGMDPMLIVLIICQLTDIVFAVILIVAGHKKNPKLLRISFIYSMVWLVVFFGLGGFVSYLEIGRLYRRWGVYPVFPNMLLDLIIGMTIMFAIILVQVYLILLTRSMEIKLRNQNLAVQFVNNAAEGESRCVCTDNGHDIEVV